MNERVILSKEKFACTKITEEVKEESEYDEMNDEDEFDVKMNAKVGQAIWNKEDD